MECGSSAAAFSARIAKLLGAFGPSRAAKCHALVLLPFDFQLSIEDPDPVGTVDSIHTNPCIFNTGNTARRAQKTKKRTTPKAQFSTQEVYHILRLCQVKSDYHAPARQ